MAAKTVIFRCLRSAGRQRPGEHVAAGRQALPHHRREVRCLNSPKSRPSAANWTPGSPARPSWPWSRWSRPCCATAPPRTWRLLPGRTIERVDRIGKFIIVVLDGGLFLTLHLGMTGQLLIDPAEPGTHTRFVFRLASSGAGRTPGRAIGARVPRHAQVRALPPDRRRPGAPAGRTWVPTPGRATGTRPTWSGGCAAARRRSRPFCWTSATWPASATSTPTRSSGGRALSPLRRSRDPGGGAGLLPGGRDPHQAVRGREAAGLLAVGLRGHGGTAGRLPGVAAGLRQARAGVPPVRGDHGADGGRGRGTAYCPDCQR